MPTISVLMRRNDSQNEITIITNHAHLGDTIQNGVPRSAKAVPVRECKREHHLDAFKILRAHLHNLRC